jgi:hypothetical protein
MLRGVAWAQRCLAARFALSALRSEPGPAWPPRQITCLNSLKYFGTAPPRWQAHRAKSAVHGEIPTDGSAWEEVEYELPSHCAGCGVVLQQDEPEAAG